MAGDDALRLLLIVDYIFDWARDVYRPSILRQLKSLTIGEAYDHTSLVSDSDIFSLGRNISNWIQPPPSAVDELDSDEQSTVPISGLRNHFNFRQWSHEEVLVCLIYLNSNIEEIRDEFQKDKKKGMSFASQRLSAAIGNGCTPERVKCKIHSLWMYYGSGGGPQQPDPIYLFGVSTRTLPYLDNLHPGMLGKIASGVEHLGRKVL